MKSLKILWSEADARTLWEGLEANKSLLEVEFLRESRSTTDAYCSWYGFVDPLLRRNKLLCEAEEYCREDREPQEFLDQLCSLSTETISYFNSTDENMTKRDVVRFQTGEEPPPLPANFSAVFVTIRKYLPHFVNKSIFVHLLIDATEEELRTIDFDAYGDISGESRETIRRVWNEMTRRNRELSRRNRELVLESAPMRTIATHVASHPECSGTTMPPPKATSFV